MAMTNPRGSSSGPRRLPATAAARCLPAAAAAAAAVVLLCASFPALAAASSSVSGIASAATTLAASASLLLLPLRAAANSALDELDRPQAAEKINIHGWGPSSDDSSDDDDEEDDGSCLKRNADGSCQIYSNVQHFRNDFGELEFKWSSCNDPYDDNHDDFEEVHAENSLYQKVIFEENLQKGDKCLRLDSTLQQCSSYRPHYHEPFVHMSASYLNEGYLPGVRRVVFVGGGDSMLLHEILKYGKHLELVLGLELDQKVTRNSFEHFKTQPHFDDPRVQWWFGDGAKSLTLLPREYFGTFDLVLLDLSETVMSMTVTKGLDVFGAMKLLLSPRGILVKNDFGYFEKLSKVFDTCMQLLIPDVTYICDYELVLCGSDEVDFLNPTFYHMRGVKGHDNGLVETLVYRPQDDIDKHWGPVTDFSKYWGEPKQCEDTSDDETDEDSVAYAGVLMIVEAENVSLDVKIALTLETALKSSGFNILSTTMGANAGTAVAVSMKEGYVIAEVYPEAKYCKLDIHLWSMFDKQEKVREALLKGLGSDEGNWSSYRIVTGGMRGTDSRPDDLKAVGPDLSKIGKCEPAREGSKKIVMHDSSYADEAVLGPVIDAGLSGIVPMMVGPPAGLSAVVFCGYKDKPCRAKTNLEKQGFTSLITLWSCTPEEEKVMDSSPYERGMALQRWREAIAEEDGAEFSLCGKRSDVALKEISGKVRGINLVVVDAMAPSFHVMGAHEYWLKFWKSIVKPFLLLVPILDAKDEVRTFFLKSRYNHGEEEPEFYSEIYVGDGKKTMSFGMIHEGTSDSLQRLLRSQVRLDQDDAVTFTDVRKVTIRGAMREQTNYNPVTFSWADYDQRPGLEQFYGQKPVGVQSVYQLVSAADSKKRPSASGVKKAFNDVVHELWGGRVEIANHAVGEGALHLALSAKGQATVMWDGADGITVSIFTRDEKEDHSKKFLIPLTNLLPPTQLALSDEQPRGYGKVVNKSERVNFNENPDCHDHYKMCKPLKAKGNCDGADNAKEWMKEHCSFSCGHCNKESSFAKTEL